MIQSISNGYYGNQNIGNTSGQMYNARPIFAGQVKSTADTVEFSSPQKKKEGSFIENNIGKILIGAGILAVLFATRGKGAKAVEETKPHLPPMELPTHTPISIEPLENLGRNLDNQVDDVATNIGNTSTKLSAAEKSEIENFLAMNKGLSSDYLKLQQTKAITDAALSPEEKVKQEKLYRIAIRKAEGAERKAAENAANAVKPEATATEVKAPAKSKEPATPASKMPATADVFTSEVDELKKFTETLGATDRIARTIPRHLDALKKAKTENERIKALIAFKDDSEKILTDERMTGNCNNREGLDKKILEIMDKMGMKQINPNQGDAFNAEYHFIKGMVSTNDPALNGKIEGIVRPGYIMNDGKMPRPADVFCYQYKA